MTTNKLAFFIAGFVIGLVISFFVANSQYQAQTAAPSEKGAEAKNEELPPGHPPIESEESKAAISSSKIGPLEAFGAAKSPQKAADKSENTAKSPKAENEYKNIQVLKGLPAGELMTVMKSFSEGLGVDCTYCHVSVGEAFKDEKSTKQVARKMLLMVRDMNKNYPTNGQVTCYTCHRGSAQPAS
jgi:hypothetical protein